MGNQYPYKMASQEFITSAPSKLLEPYIHFYFQQKVSIGNQINPAQDRQVTLPTGCTFMGFNFSDPLEFNSWGQGSCLVKCPVYFSGQFDSLYSFDYPESLELFGVVLRPTTAGLLTKMPINELRNSVVEADYHIDKNVRELHEKMTEAHFNRRIYQFEQWFCSHVLSTRQDSLFTDWAVEEIIKRKGIINTKTLAKTLKVSERHLQRSFKERIGLRPHRYATIVKVNHIVNEFNSTNVPLIDLLCQYEYYDKAHFRKQFRALTQTTLASYLGFQNETAQSFLNQITF